MDAALRWYKFECEVKHEGGKYNRGVNESAFLFFPSFTFLCAKNEHIA